MYAQLQEELSAIEYILTNTKAVSVKRNMQINTAESWKQFGEYVSSEKIYVGDQLEALVREVSKRRTNEATSKIKSQQSYKEKDRK